MIWIFSLADFLLHGLLQQIKSEITHSVTCPAPGRETFLWSRISSSNRLSGMIDITNIQFYDKLDITNIQLSIISQHTNAVDDAGTNVRHFFFEGD